MHKTYSHFFLTSGIIFKSKGFGVKIEFNCDCPSKNDSKTSYLWIRLLISEMGLITEITSLCVKGKTS